MTTAIQPVGDDAEGENKPDVVSTPEGDNEILPDEPLQPASDAAVTGLQAPRGDEADEYKKDKG